MKRAELLYSRRPGGEGSGERGDRGGGGGRGGGRGGGGGGPRVARAAAGGFCQRVRNFGGVSLQGIAIGAAR